MSKITSSTYDPTGELSNRRSASNPEVQKCKQSFMQLVTLVSVLRQERTLPTTNAVRTKAPGNLTQKFDKKNMNFM